MFVKVGQLTSLNWSLLVLVLVRGNPGNFQTSPGPGPLKNCEKTRLDWTLKLYILFSNALNYSIWLYIGCLLLDVDDSGCHLNRYLHLFTHS